MVLQVQVLNAKPCSTFLGPQAASGFLTQARLLRLTVLLLSLFFLEQRLYELGSSRSWGSCSGEVARWAVLRGQVPGIQRILHVSGTSQCTALYGVFFADGIIFRGWTLNSSACSVEGRSETVSELDELRQHQRCRDSSDAVVVPGSMCGEVEGERRKDGGRLWLREVLKPLTTKEEEGVSRDRDREGYSVAEWMQMGRDGASVKRRMRRRWQSA